jgi:hypothetical protein
MALRIEEIRAPEVGVALLVARMDGRGIDFDVDFRSRDIGIVQLQIAADGSKLAADIRDHHVADLEMNGRVGRVDRPGRNRGEWIDRGRHKAPLPGHWLASTSKMGGSGILLAGKDTRRYSKRGIHEDHAHAPTNLMAEAQAPGFKCCRQLTVTGRDGNSASLHRCSSRGSRLASRLRKK